MTTISIEGHIHYTYDKFLGDRYVFIKGKPMDNPEYAVVCPYVLKFEFPDGFSPIAAQVAALRGQKATLVKQFNERVAEINNRLRDLECLPAVGLSIDV